MHCLTSKAIKFINEAVLLRIKCIFRGRIVLYFEVVAYKVEYH